MNDQYLGQDLGALALETAQKGLVAAQAIIAFAAATTRLTVAAGRASRRFCDERGITEKVTTTAKNATASAADRVQAARNFLFPTGTFIVDPQPEAAPAASLPADANTDANTDAVDEARAWIAAAPPTDPIGVSIGAVVDEALFQMERPDPDSDPNEVLGDTIVDETLPEPSIFEAPAPKRSRRKTLTTA